MGIEYVLNTQIVIPNVKIENVLFDGVHRTYRLSPNEGFVLHNKKTDITDENGNVTRRYCSTYTTVNASYNFTTTTVIDGYTAYGVNEYFARPISEVAADQIYGLKPETETI